MKRFLIALTLLTTTLSATANIAQPGVFGAGGVNKFSFLFPEDSVHFQRLQMVKENVVCDLYRGYAVVKGTYWMHNASDSAFSIHIGYPLNVSKEYMGMFRKSVSIEYDALHDLHTLVNGHPSEIEYKESEEWYVWNATFPADTVTKVEVWFIMDTYNAYVSEGYNKDYPNAFIYIIESAMTWKDDIGEGHILIRLKDGLTLHDIYGAHPESMGINADSTQLLHHFKNLVPDNNHNLLLTYRPDTTVFTYNTEAFEHIAAVSAADFDPANYEDYKFNDPFVVRDKQKAGNDTGWLKWILIAGGLLLALLLFRWIQSKK